ncbi:hypothetical protein [uncultured Enterovirga sp.]|uniref:hypothetical protein n=1 Tax=uncultured Enterovirga sp. TaxID=2026352 RepID=UPI0035C9AFEE
MTGGLDLITGILFAIFKAVPGHYPPSRSALSAFETRRVTSVRNFRSRASWPRTDTTASTRPHRAAIATLNPKARSAPADLANFGALSAEQLRQGVVDRLRLVAGLWTVERQDCVLRNQHAGGPSLSTVSRVMCKAAQASS